MSAPFDLDAITAAWDAARAAAGDALAPTVAELQVSAHDLIGLMVAHAKARVAS